MISSLNEPVEIARAINLLKNFHKSGNALEWAFVSVNWQKRH